VHSEQRRGNAQNPQDVDRMRNVRNEYIIFDYVESVEMT
jgi:hypothetical protein